MDKEKEQLFTVWVGGTEVVDSYVTYDVALDVSDKYIEDRYTDVSITSNDDEHYR